jgi:nicotinamidase-related amidase
MTGLLVVDAQNRLFQSIAHPEATLEAMRVLVSSARAAGAPVFFTEDIDVGEPGSEARAIHATLTPLPTETVLEKGAADAFHGTRLEAILRERGVDTLAVCGLQTPACVFATTMGAIYRGFNVLLASDAHGTGDMDELPAERVVAYHNELLHKYGSRSHGFDDSHASVRVLSAKEIEF